MYYIYFVNEFENLEKVFYNIIGVCGVVLYLFGFL